MPVRSTMSDLIALVRTMINDPNTGTPQFTDQDIQNRLDASRDDIRYEQLKEAPSIVNAASTNNQAQFVYADYHSRYQWWEADVVLQGDLSGNFWKVIAPAASDYTTGYWQFQLTPFVNGTAPGQLPPVYATGKVYDPYCASADLLEFLAAKWALSFDIMVNGQKFLQSQAADALQKVAKTYRMQQKPRVMRMVRSDLNGQSDLSLGLTELDRMASGSGSG
jgi:hypothetical protein